MLGRHDPQGGLFTAAGYLGEGVVSDMGFYGKLAAEGPRLFRDEDFAGAYCADNGRPSVPPSMLVMARLLQFHDRISDAEVVERSRYDLRWKVALDLDLASVKAPFAKSTFQAFRVRLTLYEREGLVFERSVRAAREAGLLPRCLRVAIDSSPVRGRGAVKDTFNLLSDAIVAVVKAVAKKRRTRVKRVAREADVERHVKSPSIKGSELVDWTDADAVREFLGGLVEECDRVVGVAKRSGYKGEELELLKRILDQDVDQDGSHGGPRIREGVARDRTVSVHDPEMRHGHKSNANVYSGHKAHVVTEVDSGVITAVSVTAPGEADGAQVDSLLKQTEQLTGLPVEQAIGDTAYSTREAIKQARGLEVELVTKMPNLSKKRYGPGQFQVSADGGEALCPAGVRSTGLRKRGEGRVHFWPKEACGSCKLKPACTKAGRRSLYVPCDFHERRERERYARSSEGMQVLRDRIVVEHGIGRLKNLGAGQARHFGRAKTRVQWLWTAAVANLSLVWTKAPAWSAAPG